MDQDAIVAALKGQVLRVPDLTAIFRSWPPAQVNPHRQATAVLIDTAIDRMASEHPSLARRKRDDMAGCCARWYPQASEERLKTLALFTVWLVCWDDAVDAGEGELASDWERSERWRERTLQIIRGALGIDGAAPEKEVDAVNAVFQEFGDRLKDGWPMDQRRRLYNEIKYFVDGCAAEQALRLQRRIPRWDEYMDFRLGTIAATVMCSLLGYAIEEPLPDIVIQSPQIGRMWKQSCILFIIFNDVLSLKKELKTDCAINAVTALMGSERGLDDVVKELSRMMEQSVVDFDIAAEELLMQYQEDEALRGFIERYIDGYRAIVTGTLDFTLESPRYQLAKLLQEDGTLEIVL